MTIFSLTLRGYCATVIIRQKTEQATRLRSQLAERDLDWMSELIESLYRDIDKLKGDHP